MNVGSKLVWEENVYNGRIYETQKTQIVKQTETTIILKKSLGKEKKCRTTK